MNVLAIRLVKTFIISCLFFEVACATNSDFLANRSKPVYTDKEVVLQLYQLIKDVHEILDLGNIRHWIIAGTLLGAVRHGGLIPWDDDLDICIDETQRKELEQLGSVFKQCGYELCAWSEGMYKVYFDDTLKKLHSEGKKKRHPFVDVFFYTQQDNKIYYSWNGCEKVKQPRKDKRVLIYADELFPFRTYKFGTLSLSGPSNPLPYLKCCYGMDCMEVGVYGKSHTGKKLQKGKINLTQEDRRPAQPLGPLKDRIDRMLRGK